MRPHDFFSLRLVARAGGWIFDTLLPPLCPGCGGELGAHRWICGACRRRFRAAPARPLCLACRAQERPGGDREAGLGCARPGHARLRGYAAFWMEPPLDAVIHALKYGGRPDLARPLGRLLARGAAPGAEGPVIGVPLHRTRRRERGYNQAELLARAAASRWGLVPVTGALARSRATRPQARLSEGDRVRNLAGAFRVVEPGWVRDRTWILVDDVMTTGSTALAAGEALLAAGARRVVPVALALA